MNNLNEFLEPFIASGSSRDIISIPRMERSEFLSNLRPGDILLTGRPVSINDIRSILLPFVQNTFISSSKVYVGGGKVIGYGVDAYSGRVGVMDINKFLDNVQLAILCRFININDDIKRKLLYFLKSRIDLQYNTKLLTKTLLYRFISRRYEPSDQDINMLSNMYFCSNIISAGLKYAGADIKWKYGSLNVWPIDFLTHNDFDKVSRYGFVSPIFSKKY